MSIAREPATLWRPLRIPLFRDVFIADLVSDIGTFMQSVGAAWLMVSLGADATFADCHYNVALLYEALGKPREAIRHMAQYRRLQGKT